MKKDKILNLILSAMFLAIGLVLPFLTGQMETIGNMLLPMHIPVLLCGFICGWQYGLTVGFILPIMRSAIFSMPVMFPNAVSMAFELATYGLIAGLIFLKCKKKNMISVYISLISAMVCGRLVWGFAQMILLGAEKFTYEIFVGNAVLNAVPGIILQLCLIPAIMAALKKGKFISA